MFCVPALNLGLAVLAHHDDRRCCVGGSLLELPGTRCASRIGSGRPTASKIMYSRHNLNDCCTQRSLSWQLTGYTGSSSRIAAGWTAGGGAEYAISRDWTLRAEYLYVNLGSDSFAINPNVTTQPSPGPSACPTPTRTLTSFAVVRRRMGSYRKAPSFLRAFVSLFGLLRFSLLCLFLFWHHHFLRFGHKLADGGFLLLRFLSHNRSPLLF